jgi:hypothetical protein
MWQRRARPRGGYRDNVERFNALQEAAYAKCKAAFDWTERGEILFAAMQSAASRSAVAAFAG